MKAAFPLKSGIRQGCPFPALLFGTVLECNNTGKEIKGI